MEHTEKIYLEWTEKVKAFEKKIGIAYVANANQKGKNWRLKVQLPSAINLAIAKLNQSKEKKEYYSSVTENQNNLDAVWYSN